ncbi:transcriptional regulator family: GATA type zinc finger [Penicillium lagena]|uniref:transcriptional regulator family: GATA type zinc finger n=1 Tax=Penicillium lagena TaxID=94218 RepID=UPI00253FF2BE|nr:transcriptional regulator family: GATA type zinc finger [Penicillium lagena]KAJ5613203.1 transcriptional regulator family: GATA type zinc finger [Penicillium lagena]
MGIGYEIHKALNSSPHYHSPPDPSSTTRSKAAEGSSSYGTPLSDLSRIGKLHYSGREHESYISSSVSTSLPGLAALASVASAPESNLRYVFGLVSVRSYHG